MQENLLFEYAVIRVVPHVEREEFVNVGVILLCGKMKFLKTKFQINESRIHALCKKTDIDELRKNIEAFQNIADGNANGGPIGKLSLPERFRWLTASRSTVLQTSKVHPGLTRDPQQTIDRLFEQLVVC